MTPKDRFIRATHERYSIEHWKPHELDTWLKFFDRNEKDENIALSVMDNEYINSHNHKPSITISIEDLKKKTMVCFYMILRHKDNTDFAKRTFHPISHNLLISAGCSMHGTDIYYHEGHTHTWPWLPKDEKIKDENIIQKRISWVEEANKLPSAYTPQVEVEFPYGNTILPMLNLNERLLRELAYIILKYDHDERLDNLKRIVAEMSDDSVGVLKIYSHFYRQNKPFPYSIHGIIVKIPLNGQLTFSLMETPVDEESGLVSIHPEIKTYEVGNMGKVGLWLHKCFNEE